MAIQEKSESYRHATIDVSDLTLTEYVDDCVRTYSILEMLRRWNGVPDIEVVIRRGVDLPEDGR